MTEKDSKLYSLKYFHILQELLVICDKYEISEQDHILNYGKSVLVYDNFKRAKPIDQEHRELRRLQVAKSILSLVDILDDLEKGEILSESDQSELKEIVDVLLEGEFLKDTHIKKGKMVYCDGMAYTISDIDYHDFTVKLVDVESDTFFWEKPTLCKSSNYIK